VSPASRTPAMNEDAMLDADEREDAVAATA
jgi:hypothetical protein